MTAEEMTGPKFGTLVAHILDEFDAAKVRASQPGATQRSEVQEETLRNVLHWAQGYAKVRDLDGLREKYGSNQS